MRSTMLHINAVIGMLILAAIAITGMAIMVYGAQNDGGALTGEIMMGIITLIGGAITGIVVVVKHFAGIAAKCPKCGYEQTQEAMK